MKAFITTPSPDNAVFCISALAIGTGRFPLVALVALVYSFGHANK